MSHEATIWAIKQRGLKPAAKLVLWHLADRFHPDNGCFPSQETLAYDCEMSRSTINEHLAALEQAGLIARDARKGEHGRQLRTRYRLGCEQDFEPNTSEKPCPESGHGTESGKDAKPSPENAENRVRPAGHIQTSKEPVSEPLNERDRESEIEEQKRAKASDAAFWRVIKDWPNFAAMPKHTARAAWDKLSLEDQQLAEDRRDAWLRLLKAQHKSHVPAPATYFGERLFAEVAAPTAAQGGEAVYAPPFGKLWGALLFTRLIAGPIAEIVPAPRGLSAQWIAEGGERGEREERSHRAKYGFPIVNGMLERADDAKGATFGRSAFLDEVGERFVPVKVGGDDWHAWRQAFDAQGWPWLPDTGKQQFVYFPACGPAGIEQFITEIKASGQAAA